MSKRRVAIWLDDLRDPTTLPWSERIDPNHEAVWVKNRAEFEEAVLEHEASGELAALHFDNDLGVPSLPGAGQEGRHCFTWFEKQVHERGWGKVSLYAHTANPSARRELTQGFQALQRYWDSK